MSTPPTNAGHAPQPEGKESKQIPEQIPNDGIAAEAQPKPHDNLNEDEATAPTPNKQQSKYNDLLARSSATIQALVEERNHLHTQLVHSRTESAKVQKDNTLLRAEIVAMTRAREPLREESFFIAQFNELAADIESWAARETRKPKLEKLGKKEAVAVMGELGKYGVSGGESGRWFGKQSSGFVVDRRNRIALIRHVVAVVLVDRVLDRFVFGMSRDFSNFLTGMEMWICMNEKYSISMILQTRQAIGTAAAETGTGHFAGARESTIQSLATFLCILLPKTSQKEVESFAKELVERSIALKDAMVKEQAIYRCDFFSSGTAFNSERMKVATGAEEKGKVKLTTFPGLRRFNVTDGKREFVPVVKAWTDLE